MKSQPIIDFCSVHEADNINHWSGLNYFIWQMLVSEHFNVNLISGLATHHSLSLKFRYRINALMGYNFYYGHTTAFGKYYAKQLQNRLTSSDSIIFTLHSPFVSWLNVPNRIVLYNDATLKGLLGYYNYFSDLGWYNRNEAYRNEQKALQRADLLLYASDWAAEHAKSIRGVDPAKVHVVPFGANLQHMPMEGEIKNQIFLKNQRNTLNLLFVGVDFDRKGGAKAIEVVQTLRDSGVSATLTMVGMRDLVERNLPDFVTDAGFLNKSDVSDSKKLDKYFCSADIFLMPSEQECYGLVFAEAFAYGLPVIATNTGGVSTIVQHGKNGYLFDVAEPAISYCKVILNLQNEPNLYRNMALAALNTYQTKLNWKTAGQTISNLLANL